MTTRQDFETRFSVMGKDIENMLNDEREEWSDERKELKNKWDTLEARRVDISKKGESAWEGFKDEMDAGWEEIRASYDDLKRRMGV